MPDVPEQYRRKLQAAVRSRNTAKALAIMEEGCIKPTDLLYPKANRGGSVLAAAAASSAGATYNAPLVRDLIDRMDEADKERDIVSMAIVIHSAISLHDLSMLQFVQSHTSPDFIDRRSPVTNKMYLSDAVCNSSKEVIRWILETGADPDGGSPGSTVVHAAKRGDHEILHLLKEYGATFDVETGLSSMTTPIEWAISGVIERKGDESEAVELVSLLLSLGAKPAEDVGLYPMERATVIAMNSTQLLELLQDHGMDFFRHDGPQLFSTALFTALTPSLGTVRRINQVGEARAARWLIERGHITTGEPVFDDPLRKQEFLAVRAAKENCAPLFRLLEVLKPEDFEKMSRDDLQKIESAKTRPGFEEAYQRAVDVERASAADTVATNIQARSRSTRGPRL